MGFLAPEMEYVPHLVPEQIVDAWQRIREAEFEAFKLFGISTTIRRLSSGLLVNDIITNMQTIVNSTNDPESKPKSFLHYSSHDTMIVSLLGTLNSVDSLKHRPDYSSSIIIELHQDGKGVWYVKAYVMSSFPGKLVELELNDCNRDTARRCTFSSFHAMLSRYKIDKWASWMRECGNELADMNFSAM